MIITIQKPHTSDLPSPKHLTFQDTNTEDAYLNEYGTETPKS